MSDLTQLFNLVCRDLPDGYEMQICLENGAAYVTMTDSNGNHVCLPDSTDKSIHEEIMCALNVANVAVENQP
jgi:hypothetical protein